jgi:hypothetical protein
MGIFVLRFDEALIPELASRYTYPLEDEMIGEIGPQVGPQAMERGYFISSKIHRGGNSHGTVYAL